jgi:hypothetical protein
VSSSCVSEAGPAQKKGRAQRRRVHLRRKQAAERARRAQRKFARFSAAGSSSLKGGACFCGESGLLRSGVVGGRPPEPPLRPARSHKHKCSAALLLGRTSARPHKLKCSAAL